MYCRFVRCRQMAAAALEAVESGELELEPPALHNIWRQWLHESRWAVRRLAENALRNGSGASNGWLNR